ncbi:CCA tRNA nucleotidyltransferase [Virgibacillus byunsanensis]|uniref:CCA-adding enzyme n=1 Tax=Virgibacillus byunsanensis TaxID=570945 RepID=A0ABW3LMV0_9BACI
MIMLNHPFEEATAIIEELEIHGHQAYFVGGCVRDLLLNRSIGDIDIATSAKPQAVQEIFQKVIPVGIDHGTVIVRHNKQSYEVTTFRIDGSYSDKRHPDDVQFIQTIDQDLKRRDFTINALAMDKDGSIIDLFNGRDDIKHKLIRTVGNGYERFTEDALRIIRALRFSSQLGFVIEDKTLDNIKQVQHQIKDLAVERIANEIVKLFAGDFVNLGIDYLKQTNVYKHLPIMIEYPYIVERIPAPIKPLHSFAEIIALFHHVESEVSIQEWIRQWKCSNKTRIEALQLADALTYYRKYGLDNWLVYSLHHDYYNGFIRLQNLLLPCPSKISRHEIDSIEDQLCIQTKKDLALDGNDIHQLFPNTKKGPWVGHLLDRIEKEVVFDNVTNEKLMIKEWINWNPPEID